MRLRQGRAVDRDEGTLRPRRRFVDGPRQQLLAGAGLAQQQHGGDRWRRLHHGLHGPAPGQRLPDQALLLLGSQLLAQRAVLLHQRPFLQRLGHRPHHVGALDRLGDEVVGALLHRLDRVLHRPVGGHQDGLGLRRHAPAGLEQVHAGHPGHQQVGQQHRDRLATEDVERRSAAAGGQHAQPFAFEDPLQRIDDAGFVVDDQHRRVRDRAIPHSAHAVSGWFPSWPSL